MERNPEAAVCGAILALNPNPSYVTVLVTIDKILVNFEININNK